ncbi:EFR1 family ferrodoxin [Desulfovibrio ferrophilus]|uniref:Ferredoxin n=1 Tax=Desulfovibrio ferrophilus TaxID=241368 RepID=A0A2Z6AZE6_9BACT|nr:EFR1 family ferrodoxin [Desulfovibrio ferrophilus]BBD08555.1 ferredoxin [Desulfovibrio ferrophilus]
MEIQLLKLVYFSPTGTTKRVVHGIAAGIRPCTIEEVDITTPRAREMPLLSSGEELLIVAVPVYMGRVPGLLSEWLNSIQAHDTPTVCVVVYGNRVYDNALLELKDIVTRRGCVPIAGAAYVGEHSFSNSETPSKGRPDKEDLGHAERFGRKIREKLQSISSLSQVSDVVVPGTRPYGGITKLWDVDFIAVSDLCVRCGVCAEVCPVGAVDAHESARIDHEKCITCCACIKKCPQGARTMKPGLVMEARRRVNTLFVERKAPEYFLD